MSERFRPTAHRVPADPIAARMRAFDTSGLEPDIMPVDDLRRRGDQRARRQRLAGAGAAVAALAVAGIIAVNQLGGQPEALPAGPATETTATEDSGAPTTPAETTPVPTPSSEPTTPATPTPSETAGGDVGPVRTVDLGVATIEVPLGWSVTEGEGGFLIENPPPNPKLWCLDDPATTHTYWCDLELQLGAVVSGASGTVWTPGQNLGWYHPTDLQHCPAQDNAMSEGDPGYGTKMPEADPQKSFSPVGDRTAELWTYSSACNSGETFTPRVWWLPETGLYVRDVLSNPLTEQILGSVKFTG